MKSAPGVAAAIDARVWHMEHAGAGAPAGHCGVAAQCSGATRPNCHFPLLPHDMCCSVKISGECSSRWYSWLFEGRVIVN